MIRKILALIALCGIAWGTCGTGLYKKDNNSYGTLGRLFDFQYSFNAANAEAKRKFYSGFKCVERPNQKDDDSVYLTHIDFSTGAYTCEYVLGNSKSIDEQAQAKDKISPENVMLQHQHYAETRVNHSCKEGYEGIVDDAYNIQVNPARLENKARVTDYIGNIATKITKETSHFGGFWTSIDIEHPEVRINFAEPKKKIEEIKGLIKDVGVTDFTSKKLYEEMYAKPNANPTVSEFFSAAVTLDADYFKSQAAINPATGSANFKDAIEFTKSDNNWILNGINTVGEFFGKDLGIKKAVPVSPTQDLLDSKVWGFYIAFIENMRIAEHSIVLMLFFAGFVGFSAQKLVQAGYNHWGDQDSKTDIGWKKMTIAPITTVILFLAPIVPTGLTINDSFIKPEGEKVQAGIVLNGGGAGAPSNRDGERMRETTLIQTAIQYFVHWGVLAGNTLADYALYPYLNYIQISKGGVVADTAKAYEEVFKKNKQDFLVLQREVEFYSIFCKPLYGEANNMGILIDNMLSGLPPLSLPKKTETSNDKASILQTKEILGATTISAELCAKMESNIYEHSQSAVAGFIYTDKALQATRAKLGLEKVGEAKDGEKVLTIQNFVKRLAHTQEIAGWNFSAIVPISYTFYKADMLGDTLSSQKKAARSYVGAASARENRVTSNNPEDDSQSLMGENAGETDGFIHSSMVMTTYFMFPGFKNVFDMIYGTFNNAVDKIVEILYAPIGGDKNIVSRMLKFTTVAVVGAAKAVGAILSLFAAVFIYDFMLEAISLVSVAMMAIFRIAFYYVEVLIFFVASPAVVIWAVVSKKSEVIWHYIGKAAVLTITPLLIVLSCYLFIFTVEIVNSLYALISGLIEAIFITEEASITQALQVTMALAIGFTLMKVIYILIGYIIIIRFNAWFLQTIGVKESVMEETTQRLTDKTSGLYSPIK